MAYRKELSKPRGFTLIEIMMVIAIIAIVAMLALPSRLGAITQQRVVETLGIVKSYEPLIEGYYLSNFGKFPEDNEAAGMPEPRKILGNYLEKVVVREGAMHLYLGQKLPDQLHNKILTVRPVYVEDSLNTKISWICGFDEVPNGMKAAGKNLTDVDKLFLPGRCR